jgi:hypothetical protein
VVLNLRSMRILPLAFIVTASAIPTLQAGEADVVDVKVAAESKGTFGFDVTVRHADAGWQHYADKWDVVGPDGEIYATRVLAHPHDDEQPFTRSENGVAIPQSVKSVTVRAHDLVHGYGGREMTVALPGR